MIAAQHFKCLQCVIIILFLIFNNQIFAIELSIEKYFEHYVSQSNENQIESKYSAVTQYLRKDQNLYNSFERNGTDCFFSYDSLRNV